ncbi:hypothetical protein [Natronococcus sp.]|uniref:hypothetical protein n=1 Tax=Natronococcus sp. TaxID=35747 RepID=UPI003A4E0043
MLFTGSALGARSDEGGGNERDGPPFAPGDHDHSGRNGAAARLGDTSPVESISARSIDARVVNDVRHVHASRWDTDLQAEIDAAAENDERKLVVHGAGVFEPTTTVRVPDNFTLKIDDNVRLVPPADHALDELETASRTYRTLVTNRDHDAGNENVAVEGGYVSFENLEWEGFSHAPVWFHNCESPRQKGVTVTDVMHDYGSEAGTRQFGTYITSSEHGVQRNCVARRVGYDGIANRGTRTGGKMIGCEAYDIPGTGIQFAWDVREESVNPEDIVVRNCITDEFITVHVGGGGLQDVLIKDNECRIVSLIVDGPVENVALQDNRTDCQQIAIRDSVENVQLRGQQGRDGERYRPGFDSAVRLIGYDWSPEGSVETLTISDCYSRDDVFISNELVDGVEVSQVRVRNTIFDPDGDSRAAFVDGADAENDIRLMDIAQNTVHNAPIIDGGVDTVRLENNTQRQSRPPGVHYDTSDLFVEASTEVDDTFPDAIQLNADGDGDWWEFEFDVSDSGEFEINLDALFGPSTYGIYDVEINGEHVDTLDFFADGDGRETITYDLDLQAGTNSMRFEVVGTNEDASDYNMALYSLVLRDEHARDRERYPVTTGSVTRVLRNGRGTNDGDPSTGGEWHGYTEFAEASNALILDTRNDDWYRAHDGRWIRA